MYLSRLELLPQAASDPGFRWRDCEPYQYHRLLWRCFSDGPERQRDFLYRQEGRLAYALSQRPPQPPDPGWRVDTKPFAPRLRPGQTVGFALRVNPVVSRRDQDGRQSRHDVVMEAKTKLRDSHVPRDEWPSQTELERQAGLDWLNTRAEPHGFQLEPRSLVAEGYRQWQFRQRGRKVSVTVLDLAGVLTVRDPEAFLAMLAQGLGPAKGFGCGLMLIRRA